MRKFHEFECKTCCNVGEEVRRIDLNRNCPWSIMAVMQCNSCNTRWTTYIRDESRITPFDVFDDEDDESA